MSSTTGPPGYSGTRRKPYGKKKGPYGALTSAERHTDPLYPKPEQKIYDADVSGNPYLPSTGFATIPITGGVGCLNRIGPGSGLEQFIGNQISIKSLTVRYCLRLNATNPNVPSNGRVMYIWDKSPNGQIAGPADILANVTYLSWINLNYRDRFVILRNEEFSLSPAQLQTKMCEHHITINMRSTYDQTATNRTVPLTGALLIMVISDQGAFPPIIEACNRVRYYDN